MMHSCYSDQGTQTLKLKAHPRVTPPIMTLLRRRLTRLPVIRMRPIKVRDLHK
jgi:hypothetical protein